MAQSMHQEADPHLQLLVIFVSPMDGNSFRYIYPLALYVPLVLLHAVYIPDKL